MKHISQRGFTLLEVTLATTIGIIASIGMYYSYNVYAHQIKEQRGKLILATVRNSIHFYKESGCPAPFGGYPPIDSIQNNNMNYLNRCPSIGDRPFYGDSITKPFPVDPFKKMIDIKPSTVPNDDSGGWIYDDTTGTFLADLAEDDLAYGSKPSTW